MKRLALALALCALLFAAPAPCAHAQEADETVFEHLQSLAAEVQTIQSSFVQEKHLSLFKHVIRSTGRFAFAHPDSLRWEYVKPSPMGFSMSGGKGRQWDAASGLDKEFDPASDPIMAVVAEQLFSWTTFDLDALRREYAITVDTGAPVRLRLEPVRAGMHEFIDHLDVEFAEDGQSVRRVEIHEQDGDFTRIVFSDTVINAPLPEGTF